MHIHSIINLPLASRVRFQSADDLAVPFLSRHGFTVEIRVNGGDCIARRDLYQVGGWLPEEPPPPRFPMHII
jgi:hypothetical protein